MATIARDLGYYNATWHQGSNGATGVDWLADTDTTDEAVLTSGTGDIAGGHFGVGSDDINWPTDIPTGYTLTDVQYVVIAYTETGGDITVDASGWGYTPAPETWPFITLQSSGRGGNPVIDHLPIGGYDGETVGRFSDLGAVAANLGYGVVQIDTQDTFSPVHIAYFALRLTYTGTEVETPCDTDVSLDLSAATFVDALNADTGDPEITGQYGDGVIYTTTDGWYPAFYFPGLALDSTESYKITVTYDGDSAHDAGGREVIVNGVRPGHEQDDSTDTIVGMSVIYDTGSSPGTDTPTFTIGSGRSQGDPTGSPPGWDDDTVGVAAGYTVPLFQTDVDGAVSAITIRKLCTFVIPPLRQYPRSDGLGASSVRRLWPPPPTIQASNRRGPSAIL